MKKESSVKRRGLLIPALAAALVAVAGCFDEPEPAHASVRPAARVYLKNERLATLTADALLEKGRVLVSATNDARTVEGARFRGAWAPLSDYADAFDPRTVDYLNLDANALTNVDALSAFTALKWLRLNGNRLAVLPDLSRHASLRRVYLADNAFDRVPDALEACAALTDIDLSGNPIKEIPDWLARKTGLEGLSLNRTGLTKLPDDLSAWRSLRQLQLGGLRLSADEMARIRRALPDTAVVF
jgi:Leucine-rich repeat (LRR) protein